MENAKPVGHEKRDVSVRAIVWASVGLGILIVVSLASMYGLFGYLASRQARLSPPASPLASEYGRQAPPAPRLQDDPHRDLEALRARESVLLNDYAWVDKENGVVRIPIARAIELLVERSGDADGAEPRRTP